MRIRQGILLVTLCFVAGIVSADDRQQVEDLICKLRDGTPLQQEQAAAAFAELGPLGGHEGHPYE